MFEFVEDQIIQGARIKVVGIGGGGGNAINTMIDSKLRGVDFVAANTDLQALNANQAPTKIQLGMQLTKGLGAGADPEIGRNAAIESEEVLFEEIQGADMVFITGGMGGGTGTGSAPIIARIAKEANALTVGVVTKPFAFEGRRRGRFADKGIEELRENVDTLIVIPNERLVSLAGKETSMLNAFRKVDEVLLQAVKGISDLVLVNGLINLDFADVRTVMAEMGMALMGTGRAHGENRALDAATRAISSPLLENVSISGATGIVINITGGPNLTLHEVNEAAKLIQEEAHEDANIIFGSVIDKKMGEDISVTVIATGFNKSRRPHFAAGVKRPTITTAPRPVTSSPQPVLRAVAPALQGPKTRPETPVEIAETEPILEKRKAPANLKEIASEIGYSAQDVVNMDEYDIPTFLRKHAD